MLQKWIVCRTEDTQASAFAQGQLRWADLSSVPGFLGQLGGWSQRQHEACVLGSWTDHASYLAFMADEHDQRYEQSGQASTYHSSEISLFNRVFDMPGGCGFEAGVSAAHLMRVADCQVHAERIAHFVEVQESMWRPTMAESSGYLAGRFAQSKAQPSRFLITSLWASKAEHDSYGAEVVPRLRRRAQVDIDVETVIGHTVTLQPGWTVEANAEAIAEALGS